MQEAAQVLHVSICDVLRVDCALQEIHVTAYSPLGSPDSAEMMKRSHKEPLMQNAKVQEVASKHNKAAAEVSISCLALISGDSVLMECVACRLDSSDEQCLKQQSNRDDNMLSDFSS